MIRYYLIPFEPASVRGEDVRPKYLALLGTASGYDSPTRDWYIVSKDDSHPDGNLARLESMPDVVRLDEGTAVEKLAAIGITAEPATRTGDERAAKIEDDVTRWLFGKTRGRIGDYLKPVLLPEAPPDGK